MDCLTKFLVVHLLMPCGATLFWFNCIAVSARVLLSADAILRELFSDLRTPLFMYCVHM